MSHKASFSIQNLSMEVIEELLFQAEEQARAYIQSQIPPKEIKTLDILIEFNSDESKIDCMVEMELIKRSKYKPEKVTEETTQIILRFIENELQRRSK